MIAILKATCNIHKSDSSIIPLGVRVQLNGGIFQKKIYPIAFLFGSLLCCLLTLFPLFDFQYFCLRLQDRFSIHLKKKKKKFKSELECQVWLPKIRVGKNYNFDFVVVKNYAKGVITGQIMAIMVRRD